MDCVDFLNIIIRSFCNTGQCDANLSEHVTWSVLQEKTRCKHGDSNLWPCDSYNQVCVLAIITAFLYPSHQSRVLEQVSTIKMLRSLANTSGSYPTAS